MVNRKISEIVYDACKAKTKKDKIEILKKNNSIALRTVLALAYDKNLKLLIPKVDRNDETTRPPYRQSNVSDSQGVLYSQYKKLPYFVEGCIAQKPFKGLTIEVIRSALGNFV